MLAKARSQMGLWAGLLAAACADGVTGPPLAACSALYQPLVLPVGQYRAVDPTLTQGCVVFPANASATDSAEYLLVPQLITETPDISGTFRLAGTAPVGATASVAAALQSHPASPAERFHNMLREMEQARSYPGVGTAPSGLRQAAPSVPAQVAPGDRAEFKVIPTLNGLGVGMGLVKVVAFAQSVGQHVAIFVDSAAPAGGLSTADIDAMRDAFDQRLYAADTAAFGRESDIDGNGLVIVLMTNQVNKLVNAADCLSTGYVAGFFYGADIDPGSAYLFNNGEVFYTMVADSGATLSCSHPVSQVKRVVPGTLVHEFQHMISYNQHVLIRHTGAEVLWLNEALSHYAEELGGRTALPDTITFCNYLSGDLRNVAQYLAAPGGHPLVDTSGVGGLPERGAGWLFVRYLVDRFASDTTLASRNAVTRALDQTSLRGTANVTAATAAPFTTTVGEWALANWVSDLPGFTAPAALKYKTWSFRSAYPALNGACGSVIPPVYPLVAAAADGRSVSLAGTMKSGSGAGYQRAFQAPGAAAFNVLFSDSTGGQLRSTAVPRLNVLRIR